MIWYDYVFINAKPVTCQCPGYLHYGGLQWSKGPPTSTSYRSPTSTSYRSPILIPRKSPRPQGSLKFQPNKIAGQCEVFDHPGEVHRAPILGNPVPWLHFLDDSPALLNDVPESLCSFLDGDPPVTKRGNGKSSIYRWFLNSNLNF